MQGKGAHRMKPGRLSGEVSARCAKRKKESKHTPKVGLGAATQIAPKWRSNVAVACTRRYAPTQPYAYQM